jgi:hypothetical protein
VPLPLIISILKTWQHDPEFIALKHEQPFTIKKKETEEDVNTLNKAIEKALIPFKEENKTKYTDTIQTNIGDSIIIVEKTLPFPNNNGNII